MDLVYRKERSVISGGFLAADVPTINRFYVFFYITFMGLLDNGKVDDDQVRYSVLLCLSPDGDLDDAADDHSRL